MKYDPAINSERLRESVLAAIAGEAVVYSGRVQNTIVALFDDPIDISAEGRVRLFQRAFLLNTGAYLEIVSAAPRCLQVTFGHDLPYLDAKEGFFRYMKSQDFSSLCDDLNVSYAQFAGEVFRNVGIAR